MCLNLILLKTYLIIHLYNIAVGVCNKSKGSFDGSLFETAFYWLSLIIATIPPACIPIGLLPALNILTGELFPTEIRNISVGIVKAVTYVAAYINMTVYPLISSSADSFFELMLGYGAISAFMALWAIITVKDTDHLSLVEIERLYKNDEVDYKTLNTETTGF